MTVRVTWLGHSAFSVQTPQATLIIDPFLSGNTQAAASAADVVADYILVTHGHGDHVGDTVEIAKRTGATVISNFEICNWLADCGVAQTHAQHIGGAHTHPFGTVKLTIAHHGSALPDGSYGGQPAGFLLTLEGKRLYFAGDTGLFYDMRLIGEEGLDLVILPIGDNFTMGPDDALRAVRLLEPKVVVPTHFSTWPVIEQDAQAWADRVQAETQAEVVLLAPGESYTLA